MNFLRQNLFLVCTVAVLVIASAVLLAFASSAGEQSAKYAKRRTVECDSMRRLTAGDCVNERVVKAAEQRVTKMRQEHEEVTAEFLATNRRHYRVLSFRDPDKPTAKAIPAFPIDPEKFQTKGLRLLFPEEYRQEVLRLLKSMKPTVAPTPEEIKQEADRIAEKEGKTVQRRGRGPAMPMRGPEDYYPRPAYPMVRTGKEQPDKKVELTPLDKARVNQVFGKSVAGAVYADEQTSMHMALLSSRVNYTDDLLWLAQLSLWVQRDIVEAINKTNQEVREARRDKAVGVAASAVKRLVRTDVRGLVMGHTPRGMSRPDQASPRAVVTPSAQAAAYLGAGLASASGTPPRLTGRVCNPLFDVLHYEVEVVVSSRELLRLYRNLLLQNYHVIVQATIGEPGRTLPGRTAAAQTSHDLYYYGTDPVVTATIVGELLLLTDWTRGRWDEQAKAWDARLPPLMPWQFLRQVYERDPNALRKEDIARLEAAGVPLTPGRRMGRTRP